MSQTRPAGYERSITLTGDGLTHKFGSSGCTSGAMMVDRSMHRQIVVSTSFAVADHVKTFLELDLSARYLQVSDLRDGIELVRLYPERAIGR